MARSVIRRCAFIAAWPDEAVRKSGKMDFRKFRHWQEKKFLRSLKL